MLARITRKITVTPIRSKPMNNDNDQIKFLRVMAFLIALAFVLFFATGCTTYSRNTVRNDGSSERVNIRTFAPLTKRTVDFKSREFDLKSQSMPDAKTIEAITRGAARGIKGF